MSGGPDLQVVVFGLGEEHFALPVSAVREILDHRQASRIPDAPDWMLGLTDVRGLSVPLVDLRARLRLVPTDTTLATRVLVVDIPTDGPPLTLGLVVDRVLDVASFASDSIETSPEIGGNWRSRHVERILRRDGDFVMLLDLEHAFLADDGTALLPSLDPVA